MTLTVVVAGWIVGWLLLWRVPHLGPAGPDQRTVSVVIPMRNEADRIPLLLASLHAQRRPADQVIVVDDSSQDGSAAVAAAFPHVEVVAASPVPQGWTGKAWACATGARHAHGEVLVFLDADVVLGADALERLVHTQADRGGLVSVQPHHRIEGPLEAGSLICNVIAVMGLGIALAIRPRHQWGAAGPCLATTRADYDRVGGHRAVAGAIAEDLALGRAYRRSGLGVQCFGGGDQVTFRMYRSFGELFAGWSKNIATGARLTPLWRRIASAVWVTALLSMLFLVVGAATGSVSVLTGVAVHAAATLQIGILGRRVGRFGAAALVWPLLVVTFAAIFLWSTIQTLVLRRTSWSGRSVPLGSDPAPLPEPVRAAPGS